MAVDLSDIENMEIKNVSTGEVSFDCVLSLILYQKLELVISLSNVKN